MLEGCYEPVDRMRLGHGGHLQAEGPGLTSGDRSDAHDLRVPLDVRGVIGAPPQRGGAGEGARVDRSAGQGLTGSERQPLGHLRSVGVDPQGGPARGGERRLEALGRDVGSGAQDPPAPPGERVGQRRGGERPRDEVRLAPGPPAECSGGAFTHCGHVRPHVLWVQPRCEDLNRGPARQRDPGECAGRELLQRIGQLRRTDRDELDGRRHDGGGAAPFDLPHELRRLVAWPGDQDDLAGEGAWGRHGRMAARISPAPPASSSLATTSATISGVAASDSARRIRDPSGSATSATRRTVSPVIVASAPRGRAHPPPRSVTTERSASNAIRLWESSSEATASRVARSSARACRARHPCPGAGTIGRTSDDGGVTPRRAIPAAARTTPSSSPSSTMRSLRSTFPRISTNRSSGRRATSCALRRRLEVPTIASPRRVGSRVTSRSEGSARGGTAATTTPSSSEAGRSLAEGTARSTTPAWSPRTISATNRPFTPDGDDAADAPRSPLVAMGTS